jgi:hypothetical protein
MDKPEAAPVVHKKSLEVPTENNRPRLYSAPRRFDLATILVVTAAYSILLGGFSALNAFPVLTIAVATFITLVGFGQALLFGGLKPRLASTVVGVFIVDLPLIAFYFFGPSPRIVFNIWWFRIFYAVVGAGVGAILGYLVGTLIGGVFLVADVIRRSEWRFSLKTLLIVTTLIAILLGLIAWLR